RLTSPEGLVLKTRIRPDSILCSDEVIAFMGKTASAEELASLLPQQQKEYIKHLVADSFHWGKLEELFANYRTELEEIKVPDRVLTERYARKWAAQTAEQNRVAVKFLDTLKTILPEAEKDNYAFLSQRVGAAATYFTKALNEEIVLPIAKYKAEISGHTLTKK